MLSSRNAESRLAACLGKTGTLSAWRALPSLLALPRGSLPPSGSIEQHCDFLRAGIAAVVEAISVAARQGLRVRVAVQRFLPDLILAAQWAASTNVSSRRL